MREAVATTPFGRRTPSLGQIAARLRAEHAIEDAIEQVARPGSNQPAAVHKWKLFRTLAEARSEIGVSDRTLGVLNALLSFHPETALSLSEVRAGSAGRESAGHVDDAEAGAEGRGTELIVFPSNRELSLRAHGMGERSIARHLASLVTAGLILRRDSPNGKRYARKARGGRAEGFSEAFGFDLSPLVIRAAEFEAVAERLRRERQRLQVLKERISLHRRDIAKTIECALAEDLPGDWDSYARRLLALSAPLRRIQDAAALARLDEELSDLRVEVTRSLAAHMGRGERPEQNDVEASADGAQSYAGGEGAIPDDAASKFGNESNKESGNDGSFDRHHHNSKSKSQNFEPASKEAGAIDEPVAPSTSPPSNDASKPASRGQPKPVGTPLGFVLDACPDIRDWAPDGIRNFADLIAIARLLRSALGVSPDAWREAVEVMGEIDAAIAIAAILQRHESSSDAVSIADPNGGPPRLAVHGSPAVRSAGGYLRTLTEQARAGHFSIASILMANIGQRRKQRPNA